MNRKDTYEALGFVEALTAILITGMASVALMDIAAKTLSTTIKNEVKDRMSQYAVEGGEMVQVIADKEILTGEDLFPDGSEYQQEGGRCFLMNNDIEDPKFLKDDSGVFLQYKYEEREDFKNQAEIDSDTNYFRVFCRVEPYYTNDNLVLGKIVVGLVERTVTVNSDGDVVYDSGGTVNVPDYEYYVIIKL